MKLYEITEFIECYAPLTSQESWDNSGLQVGDFNSDITGAVICLDVTNEVVEYTKNVNCNLIISHHPLLFDGVKNITSQTANGCTIINAISNNIAIYSSHTPFDIAQGGINDYISELLQLKNVEPLSENGIGRVGNLSKSISLEELVSSLKTLLKIDALRVSDDKSKMVKRIALCGGSGGSLIADAIAKKADVYISGDFKYHNYIDTKNIVTLIDVGHYESEKQFIGQISALIQKKIPTFATHIYSSNPSRMA